MSPTPADPDLEAYLAQVSVPAREWNLLDLALHVSAIADALPTDGGSRALLGRIDSRVSCLLESREPYEVLEVVNRVLYEEFQFRGNEEEYYDPRNSLMRCVLRRRTGIPITLSILYREVASKAGLSMAYVGLPAHFVLGFQVGSRHLFLDAFHQGRILLESDCAALIKDLGVETPFQRKFLRPVSKRVVLLRLLMNLKQIYRSGQDSVALLRVLDRRIPLLANATSEILERGLVYLELKDFRAALDDFRFFVENTEDERMRRLIQSRLRELRDLAEAE